MSEVIKPTTGRVVHFYRGPDDDFVGDPREPMLAIIAHPWSDDCVNISLWDQNGCPIAHPPTSVHLVQPGTPKPQGERYCEWMPYQVKKDTGSESGERAAGTEVIAGSLRENPAPAGAPTPAANEEKEEGAIS